MVDHTVTVLTDDNTGDELRKVGVALLRRDVEAHALVEIENTVHD
jgi:hypothetical protein